MTREMLVLIKNTCIVSVEQVVGFSSSPAQQYV